jgi:protein translocase SecG subunit
MLTLLITIFVISSLIITLSILLQKSSSMGLGAYTSDVNEKLNMNDGLLSRISSIFIFIWLTTIIYMNYYVNNSLINSVIS